MYLGLAPPPLKPRLKKLIKSRHGRSIQIKTQMILVLHKISRFWERLIKCSVILHNDRPMMRMGIQEFQQMQSLILLLSLQCFLGVSFLRITLDNWPWHQ